MDDGLLLYIACSEWLSTLISVTWCGERRRQRPLAQATDVCPIWHSYDHTTSELWCIFCGDDDYVGGAPFTRGAKQQVHIAHGRVTALIVQMVIVTTNYISDDFPITQIQNLKYITQNIADIAAMLERGR